MADPADQNVLRPSLLDRLISENPRKARGVYDYVGLRELRAAVARDLEWLLNSKRWIPYSIEQFEQANESLLTYGVPDFSTYSWRSTDDSRKISEVIEDAIRLFEPRLIPSTVKVVVLPRGEIDDFQLRFRIDAVLQVEPVTEPVSFDTEIDFESTAVKISGAS